jgi:hypothetical protein
LYKSLNIEVIELVVIAKHDQSQQAQGLLTHMTVAYTTRLRDKRPVVIGQSNTFRAEGTSDFTTPIDTFTT